MYSCMDMAVESTSSESGTGKVRLQSIRTIETKGRKITGESTTKTILFKQVDSYLHDHCPGYPTFSQTCRAYVYMHSFLIPQFVVFLLQ